MSSNLKDVAKLACVSTATVSRIINNKGYVSEKTKKKVIKAINELNYLPTKTARFLAKKGHTYNVAIISGERVLNSISSHPDEFYTVVVKGITDFAKKHRLNTHFMKMEETEYIYDGYLLLGGEITNDYIKELKAAQKPIILVDQYIPGLKIDCVISDGYDGAVYGIEYLIQKDLKKIVAIHGPLSHFGFKDRYDGYIAAMEKHGLLPKTYEYDEIGDNMSTLIGMIIRSYGKPEAIFGTNDTAAIRAMEELQKRHYKIPEDISIMGFDDIISATSVTPSLTTLKIFKYELGSVAARRLFTLLMGEEEHPIKTSLFTHFIKRESTI
ncbi:MAG: LacI family DNA-binding transcriptional regulator [Kosmotogaceae bacterium]